jgi:serine/threonine kinase 32
MDRDPHTRLGCRPSSQGLEAIRRHPWFASFDWDALERKDCQPPFVPDVCGSWNPALHIIDHFL